MDTKRFLIVLVAILSLSTLSYAGSINGVTYTDYRHSAINVTDGKNNYFNGGILGGAGLADVWCVTNCSGLTNMSVTFPNAVANASMNSTYYYSIRTDGTNYYARNGTTGLDEFKNTNFNTVMQQASDAMLKTGGTIKLAPGTYAANNQTEITINSSILIEGSGRYGMYFNGNYWQGNDLPVGTIITYPGNGTLFRINQSYVTFRDMVLKNTNINTNTPNSSAINESWDIPNTDSVVGLTVDGVSILGAWYTGIFLTDSINTNIVNSVLDGNNLGYQGVYAKRHNTLNIQKNYIQYWSNYGIFLDLINTVNIQQNIIESNAYQGIQLKGTADITILSNYFENEGWAYIGMYQDSPILPLNTLIQGNVFVNIPAMTTDIDIDMANMVTIIGNDFQASAHKNIQTVASQVTNMISLNNYFRYGGRDAATGNGGGSPVIDISLDFQSPATYNGHAFACWNSGAAIQC